MNQGKIHILPVRWNQIPNTIRGYFSPQCIGIISLFSDSKFETFCHTSTNPKYLPYSIDFLQHVWEHISDDIAKVFWFDWLWEVWLNKNMEYLAGLDRKTVETIWKEKFLETNSWMMWWNQNYLIYKDEGQARRVFLQTLPKNERSILTLDEIVKLPRAFILFLGKDFHRMNREKINTLQTIPLEDLELLWTRLIELLSIKLIKTIISIKKQFLNITHKKV